jgi:hypothetical protein
MMVMESGSEILKVDEVGRFRTPPYPHRQYQLCDG